MFEVLRSHLWKIKPLQIYLHPPYMYKIQNSHALRLSKKWHVEIFFGTCCACIIIILASDTLQNKHSEKALTFSINTLPTANNLFLVPLSWNVFGCSYLFCLSLQLTSVKLFISCLWSRPCDLTVCVPWATFWWERFWERSSCIMRSRDWTLLQLWNTRFELVFWEFDTYSWVSTEIMTFKGKAVFRVKGNRSQFYSCISCRRRQRSKLKRSEKLVKR